MYKRQLIEYQRNYFLKKRAPFRRRTSIGQGLSLIHIWFLYKKGNLTREDVGAIDVKEHYAFVAIRRAKVKQLLNLIQGEKIKGMKTIIEEAK